MNAPSLAAYRGIIQGGTVVLVNGPVNFPEGSEVLITSVASPPGTAEALLAAVDTQPHLTLGDVNELERIIAEGHRPRKPLDPFAESIR